MNSLLVVVAILFQFGLVAECSLPRLPESLSKVPAYNKDISVPNDRIVGGTEAGPNEFTYQCSLQRKATNATTQPRHYCGGSIVSDRYFITAAHCTGSKPETMQILTGTNNLYDISGKRYDVQSCTRYPGYNSNTVYGDMALCKTTTPIEFSSACQPIAIPEENAEAPEDAHYVVTGWGTTEEGGSATSNLMQVSVPHVTDQKCRDAYGDTEIHSDMLCAGKEGKDSCQGDSGGPLVYKTPSGAYTLCGIVSWGYGCARPDYPGVYTEVSKFYSFIFETCNKDQDTNFPVSSLAFSA